MNHQPHRARRVVAGAALAALAVAGVGIPVGAADASTHATSTAASTTAHAPRITRQPVSVVAAVGKKATFSATVSGDHLSYRWYATADGRHWYGVHGATHRTLTVTAHSASNGHRYRVVVWNARGKVTSHSAGLTVAVQPHITSQPRSTTVVAGKKATFHVAATGRALSYRWYAAAPGHSWVAQRGATGATYATTTTAAKNGYVYRVLVSNKAGHTWSSRVGLTVVAKPRITHQPADEVHPTSGDTVHLSVAATGVGRHYQWQWFDYSGDEGVWRSIKGATRSTYSFTATTKTPDELRAVVWNVAGRTASDETLVTVRSTASDPWDGNGAAFLTGWLVALDTDLKGGPTTVTGTAPTTVTTTFFGLPVTAHAENADLTFSLVVGGTEYPATFTTKALQYGMVDFAATASVDLPADQAEAGIWKVTDASGTTPVSEYFTQH